MYTAVVLNEKSQKRLMRTFAPQIPQGWKTYGHHMTVNMGLITKGPLESEDWLGYVAELEVTHVGMSDMAMAVAVQTDIPSVNNVKHVTIAVNTEEGGKPKMSNDIQQWEDVVPHIDLYGSVQEVK